MIDQKPRLHCECGAELLRFDYALAQITHTKRICPVCYPQLCAGYEQICRDYPARAPEEPPIEQWEIERRFMDVLCSAETTRRLVLVLLGIPRGLGALILLARTIAR